MHRLINEYFVYNKYNELDLNIGELRAFQKADTLYSIFNMTDKGITSVQFNNILRQLYGGLREANISINNHMIFICAEDRDYINEILLSVDKDVYTNQTVSVVDTARNMIMLEEGADSRWEKVCLDISEFINQAVNRYKENYVKQPKTMKEDIRSNIKYSTVWIVIINVAIYLGLLVAGIEKGDYVIENCANSWDRVLNHHEWYRLITSIFLHADADHLLGNMISLCAIGLYLEKFIGTKKFLLTYFLTGIIAGLVSLGYNMYLDEGTISIGASGAIYGLCGMFIVFLIMNQKILGRGSATRLIIYIALCGFASMTSSSIDHAAHIGGIIAGILIGIIMFNMPQAVHKNK